MKNFILFVFLAGILSTQTHGQTYVNGYIKKDGSYVNGHFRSNSNSTKLDN